MCSNTTALTSLQAQERIDFIVKELKNRLFPFVYDTSVHPGLVWQWTSWITYQKPRWGFNLGSDIWITGKERLTIKKDNCPILENLDIEHAQKPFGYQWKALGSLFFKLSGNRAHDWLLSFNADKTFSSLGTGKDFLFSINLGARY